MYKLFQKKTNQKQFAKSLRNLNPKLIEEFIQKGIDLNTKFKGKLPLEIVFESTIGSHNSYHVEKIINILINNGTIITLPIYKKYKNRVENLEELIEDIKLNPKRYVHFSIFGKKPDK